MSWAVAKEMQTMALQTFTWEFSSHMWSCTLELCEVADVKWISISWGLSSVCPSPIELICGFSWMDCIPKHILAPVMTYISWRRALELSKTQQFTARSIFNHGTCHKISSQSHKEKKKIYSIGKRGEKTVTNLGSLPWNVELVYSKSILVVFMKINLACHRFLLRSATSDISLSLNSWTTLLKLSSHEELIIPHKESTIGILPSWPNP